LIDSLFKFLLLIFLVSTIAPSFAVETSELTKQEIRVSQLSLPDVIRSMRTQLGKLDSYSARLKVDIEMPGMRIKGKKLNLQFSAPDSFSFKTKGFAILPKRAMTLSPDSIFLGLSEPEFDWPNDSLGLENVRLRGLFREDRFIVSMEFRINTANWVMTNMTARRGDEVFMQLRNTFKKQDDIVWLPASTDIEMSLAPELQKFYERLKQPLRRKKKSQTGVGLISIHYYDYDILYKQN
jgi:hypothetical protein